MQRIPEPELMTDAAQAIAYANADFEEPHNHFIRLLKDAIKNRLPMPGKAIDLGCGAADISIRMARAFPGIDIDAVDGSAAMLTQAKKAVGQAGLEQRITLIKSCLHETSLDDGDYDLIFSNSLLHHLHAPQTLWNALRRAKGEPVIFVMDLMRPDNEARVDTLVELYAKAEPEILRRDFRNSLKAAFTPKEVVLQLAAAGLDGLQVKVVSDRHLAICSK